jgi:predicted dehydrogenase
MKVAIIGLGKQNLSDHVPALIRRGDIEITAVCDPFESSYESFKTNYPGEAVNAKYYKNYTELPVKEIDFCIVSVPHDQYSDISTFLCKSGVSFMKEKPLARNLEEANFLLQMPDFEKFAFICTQRRYNPLYKKAKESIESIGTPFLFNAIYKLNIEDPAEGWRGDVKVAGGGCVLDMGYHIIDQLIWWFGKPDFIAASKSSLANSELDGKYAEDTASILFKYKSGLHGTITLSRSTGEKVENYSLHGSNGHISGDKKNLFIKNKKGEVLLHEETTDSVMMDTQLDYFINTLKAGKGFKEVVENNIKNMELIQNIYRVSENI